MSVNAGHHAGDPHPIAITGLSKTYRIPVRDPGLLSALKSVVRRRTEEVKAVKDFVAAGGSVIADSMPAVLSGHCRKLAKPPLDEVFGVVHDQAYKLDKPAGELRVSGSALGLSLAPWSEGTELPTKRVRLARGKALGRMGDTPAFIANRYGKGKACYLNFMMSKYLDRRANGKEADIRERVRAILAWAGARPTIAVTTRDGKPINKLEVLRYVSGGSLYVGCVLHTDKRVPAKATFPKPGHLYDVRRRKYLGHGSTFKVDLPAQDALVLALLPYRVNGVSVTAASARRGQLGKAAIELKATTRPGLHVFRLEIGGPDGKPIDHLAQNVLASNGRAQAIIPFALSDAPGAYTLTVRDAATGARGQASLRLQ